MRDIFLKLFTEADNQTPDVFRVLASFTVMVSLWLSVYSAVWLKHPFDMQSFGLGVGSLFAGLGVTLGLKKETLSD
jgi:hypothetical protein